MGESMAFPSSEVKPNDGLPIPFFVKKCQSPPMHQDKVTEFSGERLRELRERNQMTQQQVADSIGYARPTVGVWEQGHDFPGRDALLILSQFFGVSLTHFLPGVEVTRAPKGGNLVDDPDELALLRLWRGMDRSQRILMIRMVGGEQVRRRRVSQPQGRKRANAKGDHPTPVR